MANLVSSVWTLRDRAYDDPTAWQSIDAQAVFQALGEELELLADAPPVPGLTWSELTQLFDRVAARRQSNRPAS